ncbi:MAG: extracellular solute-binding protein [Proteobacteria bacterium]|nr:extracellular solute-binding protein [Pseudomonadota bacterium]
MAPAKAQSFADVGKQPPITILINASPWYAGFQSAVELYTKQTGNVVKLDVTPYNGVLEKARNAVRGQTSPYDILNIDGFWTIEFYEGGFLRPIKDVDPTFVLPKEVLACGNNHYWNAEKRWRTPEGGVLMGVPPNCNVHILAYRKDLYDGAGLAAPKSYDDVKAACLKLQKPPQLYGFVTRGERGNPIRYDFMPFMHGHGQTDFVKDPLNGDFTVTVNSPEMLAALKQFIDLHKTCGPANHASVGQADVIQSMSAGKAAAVQVVIAAWSNFEDKNKSTVVGKVGAAPIPSAVPGKPGVASIGNWDLTIPKNIAPEQQKAAIAFLKWFVTPQAQRAYAEAGGIPVRSDTLTSDLAKKPQFNWMAPYLQSVATAASPLGYNEGAAVEQVLGLRLNQALLGEMSPGKALNTAAGEVEAIFARSGRKTGKLPPLPE